ncbi:reverse transcriptase (RNA-dependent DNA polymerase) [[Clostridium] scindens ATCC 35704]|uniref:Group II intron-encoded protein LtrA n=1 Tax=Clostridium scindens (strain ATCC 35704 / DSM 5676 / VPI 13733 / 19) TaxID=411468 RepID=B0NAR4_CLOS5|nr:reverse transcriptase/maturase family protein [[Clostridium] scindens]EDS08222.1 reverse transcriptase (RNA-dependent DNA polymerase) [[Clostridium] scindens ATCC 35704]QBF75597.1 Group II intron-encoded protein LtrA [[Clostridium] scindens ATCC 35704]
MEFEANREDNLFRAIEVLKDGTYQPGEYRVFKVWEPKERIIMALPFFDRVIQHMIVNFIEPIFEKRFLFHSYACRKEKGVHEASKTLSKWLYELEVVQGKKIYAIKGDIHHYFQSVSHDILKAEIRRYISDKALLKILDRIIDHNGIFPPGVGIPVGNLTSQLFANVYLNKLDQFVKHELKVKYYVRYMDDFIILSEDPAELRRLLAIIEEFLRRELRLELNPKTTILAAKNGINFVGYIHYKDHKKIRKDARRRLTKLLKAFETGEVELEYFDRSIESRFGHMEHADTYNYIRETKKTIEELKERKAV